ncbi:MAG: GNAT family N-acetyltransferase, partial [Actinomycetota bacterium]|nr:GNAT family N-acetyltransferase [Actinomycetota bacterium]
MRTRPDVAEPAIVVMDDWQGRGAGSRLLDALVERAQEEGIWRFEAPVLAYNADAIHMLEALGQMTWKHRGREVELTIDLPEVEAAARVRPLLWQFAIGAVDRGRSFLERLWPWRLAALGGPMRNLIVVGPPGSGHAAAASRRRPRWRPHGTRRWKWSACSGSCCPSNVAADENARLIVVGAGEHSKL